jgi:hypothetical protein
MDYTSEYEVFTRKCPQMRYKLLEANDKQQYKLDLSGMSLYNLLQYYRQIVGNVIMEEIKNLKGDDLP